MKEYTLITGASSGIGYEMVKILASKMHNLIIVARSQDKLETLQKELKNQFDIDIQYFI
jgi:short-subunit dehydrogenase